METLKISNAADLEVAYEKMPPVSNPPSWDDIDKEHYYGDELGKGGVQLRKAVGGVEGGSCWGGRQYDWDEYPMEHYVFYEMVVHPLLSTLIQNGAIKDGIGFELLEKISFPIEENHEESEGDPYGNYTKYQILYISFADMFECLSQADVLK